MVSSTAGNGGSLCFFAEFLLLVKVFTTTACKKIYDARIRTCYYNIAYWQMPIRGRLRIHHSTLRLSWILGHELAQASSARCFKAFLQQCALRSKDFAVCHREYIGFENPDRCGSAFGPGSVRKNSSVFNAIFRVRKFS